MKSLSTSQSKWLEFLAWPLKVLVVSGLFIFPIWFHAARPLKTGSFAGPDFLAWDADKLPFGIELLTMGYFVIFLLLLMIAIGQIMNRQWRAVLWNCVFAMGALGLAMTGAIHPVYK